MEKIITDFHPENDLLIQASRHAFCHPARPEPALVFVGRWPPAATAFGKMALVRARLGARRAV